MTDKEVGELWQESRMYLTASHQERLWMQDLIRKLVEERAERYDDSNIELGISYALRDFGIKEEAWPVK